MSVGFLLTSLVVVVTPGTGVLYTLAAAFSRGRRASLVAAIGCTLGIVPQMLAAVVGLSALLNASAALFQIVKYAGVAYLLYLAWSIWRDREGLAATDRRPTTSAYRVIATAILINLLNPKLTIFFFAFLPQFVSARAPHPALTMTTLSAVFMAMTLVVFADYGVLASTVREHVVSRRAVMTWMRRAFAGTFVALAARLALADR